MTRNIGTITRWLPVENEDQKRFFAECKLLKVSAEKSTQSLINFLGVLQTNNYSTRLSVDDNLKKNLETIYEDLNKLNDSFNKAFQQLHKDLNNLPAFKMNNWKHNLWISKLKMSNYLQEVIFEICPLFIYFGETLLMLTLSISNIYNNLLNMDNKFSLGNNLAICSNTCPNVLYPMKNISITKLLQKLSVNRAELCCHKLIDCLLETYKNYDNHQDDENSDNSDVEIYRALTQHLTPTHECVSKRNTVDIMESGNFGNLEELIRYEEQNVIDLLNTVLKISPTMLGKDGVKTDKATGGVKICTKAKKKVIDYYQDILWGEAGNFLEHVILWWGSSPLCARPPHSSQHLREWIAQFTPNVHLIADMPLFIVTALTTLVDALGVHVTSTSWDRNFRLALVAAQMQITTSNNPTTTDNSSALKAEDTNTGKLFYDMLQDLVALYNQCEVTTEWIVGAPLEELPLVEQIPILHRLDHSIHTSRLWAISATKKLANGWNVNTFFLITHADIVNFLAALNGLRMTDHGMEIEKGGLGVHVEVCAKMREKLVSEVKVNIGKLKESPQECVQCLASICTTLCLAHLKMIFPRPNYWRGTGKHSHLASAYVDKYLDQILTPILRTSADHIICNMVLKLVCEAWLDHIYRHRIKFTEVGARQLLVDFDRISGWIQDQDMVALRTRRKMQRNEVLRRCEGVGKLLLRSPGEHIDMHGADGTDNKQQNNKETDSTSSNNTLLMPAEMYVPNQEQWLELRATSKKLVFVPLCCSVNVTN